MLSRIAFQPVSVAFRNFHDTGDHHLIWIDQLITKFHGVSRDVQSDFREFTNWWTFSHRDGAMTSQAVGTSSDHKMFVKLANTMALKTTRKLTINRYSFLKINFEIFCDTILFYKVLKYLKGLDN